MFLCVCSFKCKQLITLSLKEWKMEQEGPGQSRSVACIIKKIIFSLGCALTLIFTFYSAEDFDSSFFFEWFGSVGLHSYISMHSMFILFPLYVIKVKKSLWNTVNETPQWEFKVFICPWADGKWISIITSAGGGGSKWWPRGQGRATVTSQGKWL